MLRPLYFLLPIDLLSPFDLSKPNASSRGRVPTAAETQSATRAPDHLAGRLWDQGVIR